MNEHFVSVDSEGNVTWADGSISGIVTSTPPTTVTTTSGTVSPSVNISNCTFNGSISSVIDSTPMSPFRKLDKDEQKRLAHVLNGDRIHIRVKKPDFLDSSTMPDYDMAIEISDTEDFLVYVNMISDEANTLGDMFDVEHIAETLCTMLTLSGVEVMKDGKLFSPS